MEIQDLMNEQKKAWEDFKKTNDAMEEEIKAHGAASAEAAEKLDKINKRLDEIEVRAKRVVMPTGKTVEQTEEGNARKAAFAKYLRKGKEGLSPEDVKTLLVSDDTTGGFLAPAEFVEEIDKDIVEFSPIRAISRIRTTSMKSIEVPRRTGTFAAVFVGEGQTQAETEGLTYGLDTVPAHPLRALVQISNEDLEDPVFDMEAELRMEFAEQFAVAEGASFVTGNGVARPLGFNADPDIQTQDTAGSGVLASDDIIDLFYANLKSAYWANATYVMNRITIGRVRKLKDLDEQYLWQPGLNGPQQQTLLGRPIVEATDMPSTLATGDKIIALGDFRRGYMVLDRVQMDILRDPFTLGADGVVRFIARKRLGGQSIRKEAIKILTVKA